MNNWIELSPEEAKDLFLTMQHYYNNGGIRKVRINTEALTYVKIKINEGIWSPELGKKVEAN